MRNTMPFLPFGSVVVSCQAGPDSPFFGPSFMAAFARAAELGGASGFRVEGAMDTQAVRQGSQLPIIGIKKGQPGSDSVYITPSFEDAQSVVAAGADIVAVDATDRPRTDSEPLRELVRRIHDELGVPVMGDVDSVSSARFALKAGVDIVATTLSGYTGGQVSEGPDLELLRDVVKLGGCPVVAEGRISQAEHVEAAFALGAHAVVIGAAITDPEQLTRRFVDSAQRSLVQLPCR
jgi:N-acylglucosamine-6-phosphate 2-epimerase